MITRDMIKNGFENGTISIEEKYSGCVGICCKIGEMAFYFLGLEDENITKEEYWKSYTLDMTINMILTFLKTLNQQRKLDWMILKLVIMNQF